LAQLGNMLAYDGNSIALGGAMLNVHAYAVRA
jgi:hypothetical protein